MKNILTILLLMDIFIVGCTFESVLAQEMWGLILIEFIVTFILVILMVLSNESDS